MQNVIAHPKIVTRIRPTSQTCVKPAPQVLTTHAAVCPQCHREVRIGGLTGSTAIIYGGCQHLRGVDQHGISVSILFTDEAAA